MDESCRLFVLGLTGLLCLVPIPTVAQIQYGGDLSWKGNYVWRGLVFGSGSVVQPDVFVAYGSENVLGTVGIWTNVEVNSPDGDEAGFGRRWFGETDVWGEISARFGPIEAAAGAVAYFVQVNRAGGPVVNRVDTYEVYGRLHFVRFRMHPRLSIWHDPYQVKGTYLEGGVTWRIPGWNHVVLPLGSLLLGLDAGYNVGQGRNRSRPGQPHYFADDHTWTHADLSMATTVDAFKMGTLSTAFHVEFHVVYVSDTVLNAPNGLLAGGRIEPWFGVTFSVLAPRCRPERTICGE